MMRRFYVIYNPDTEEVKPAYGNKMPALYNTYGLAKSRLKDALKYSLKGKDFEVREAELHIL